MENKKTELKLEKIIEGNIDFNPTGKTYMAISSDKNFYELFTSNHELIKRFPNEKRSDLIPIIRYLNDGSGFFLTNFDKCSYEGYYDLEGILIGDRNDFEKKQDDLIKEMHKGFIVKRDDKLGLDVLYKDDQIVTRTRGIDLTKNNYILIVPNYREGFIKIIYDFDGKEIGVFNEDERVKLLPSGKFSVTTSSDTVNKDIKYYDHKGNPCSEEEFKLEVKRKVDSKGRDCLLSSFSKEYIDDPKCSAYHRNFYRGLSKIYERDTDNLLLEFEGTLFGHAIAYGCSPLRIDEQGEFLILQKTANNDKDSLDDHIKHEIYRIVKD